MKTRGWIATTALALAVSGCATTGGTVADDERQGSNAGSGSGEMGEADSPEPAETPTFGDTYEWDNGLSVKIGQPQEFQPTEYAAFDKAPTYRSFEVTVVNNTGQPVDLAGAYTTVQSGDQEMAEVFDSEQGFNGSPTTSLLDGRQARYKIGFGVAKPRDIVLQFDPGQYEPEILDAVVFASTQ